MNKGFAEPPTFDMSDRCASEPQPTPNTFYIARSVDAAEVAFAERVHHVKSLIRCGVRDAKAIAAIVNTNEQLVRNIIEMHGGSK